LSVQGHLQYPYGLAVYSELNINFYAYPTEKPVTMEIWSDRIRRKDFGSQIVVLQDRFNEKTEHFM